MFKMKYLFLILIFTISLFNCKKAQKKSNENKIYRIAGNDYPFIKDFEFDVYNEYKKDSLYLNICYLGLDSTNIKSVNIKDANIDTSLHRLYIKDFSLNEKIPTRKDYYLGLSENNTFVFDKKYNGIPFALKFKEKGKRILVYVPYENKIKPIENSSKFYSIEKHSVYLDTINIY